MSTQLKARSDYYWSEEKEPHQTRRVAILRAHPQVKKLYGHNPMTKYSVGLMVVVQMTIGFFASDILALDYGWLWLILIAYFVGATITHALFLAIHEITHYLAFAKKLPNDILALIANLPIVAPYAMSFKVYHWMHHLEQGKDGIDTDIPTRTEAKMFNSFFGKIIWFLHQIVFYALRPIFVKRIALDKWQIYNAVFQIVAMAVFFYFAGWQAAVYFLVCMLLAGSLHPTSGHFISEHYVFHEGQETYSYYGPLNKLTYNVGYHNEHHDFPFIPGSRLPELKKIAPEFYDNLHSYNSWTKVILTFLFRREISLYSRTKRK